MKKIKFLIEYGAYPIWLSYENGSEDCKLPPEWKGDDYLKTNLAKLQKLYDSFFINNENEFVFKGPKDEADRVEFNSLIFNIRNHILKNVPSNYVFEDHTLGIKA